VANRWERRGTIRLPQFEIPRATTLKLRWFGEKSGAFALNLVTRSVNKLGDGVECNSWGTYVDTRWTVPRSLGRCPVVGIILASMGKDRSPGHEVVWRLIGRG
jgi:hypothetical protein